MDSQGKVVMESILETKASTLLEFFDGLRGSLFVTFEEGTWEAWLYSENFFHFLLRSRVLDPLGIVQVSAQQGISKRGPFSVLCDELIQ